jgi:hypothetical protein
MSSTNVLLMESWRQLALATVVTLTLAAGISSAQTVIVKNAPPGSSVEVVVNQDATGVTSDVDTSGVATVVIGLFKDPAKLETDAQIFIDVCDKKRRILIAERGVLAAPPEKGCNRTDMGGWFLLKPVSSLLIDAGGPSPTLLLRQGRVSLNPSTTLSGVPTGVVLFGGGAYTSIGDVRLLMCGTVGNCSGGSSGFKYSGGVAYWFAPFLAAEATWIRPYEVNAEGTVSNFRFNSSYDADIFTVAGVVGIPAKAARPFGKVGANYHRAIFATTQTQTDATENATQNYHVKTDGWGFVFGGGVEVWIKPTFGFYGEAGYGKIKGEPLDDEEGPANFGLTYVLFGARIHIGR